MSDSIPSKTSPVTFGLYSVFDALAKEFGPPWSAKNSLIAIRHFTNLIKSSQITELQDYSCYCVGIYDPNKGTITPPEGGKPVLVREANGLIIPNNQAHAKKD